MNVGSAQAQGTSTQIRTTALLLGLLSAGLGGFLALHHPLAGAWGLLLFAGTAVGAARWPLPSLALVPVLLPVIGLMPWSGWLIVEELDLILLAIAAGGYLRVAVRTQPMSQTPWPQAQTTTRARSVKVLLLLCCAGALAYSMARGFADAGGLSWGWWQGLHEPLNSVRLAKPFFLALLVLPLWSQCLRTDPEVAQRSLEVGLASSVAVVALLAIWERHAFTNLLNFSSDYRTTALFWEMHIGGAALDGFLALTMPFAVARLARNGSVTAWLIAAATLLLGAYACLTTFSRMVYIAVPLGIGIAVMLKGLQGHGRAVTGPDGRSARWPADKLAGALLVLTFTGAAATVFPSSGYRGVLALLGAMVLALAMAAHWQNARKRDWLAGAVGGMALGVPLAMAAYLVPKGAYLAYTACWLTAAVLLGALHLRAIQMRPHVLAITTLALFIALLICMALVGPNWGGESAQIPTLIACGLMVLVGGVGGSGQTPRWPRSLRWQGSVLGVMACAAVAVGVAMGGAYMGARFSNSSEDLQARQLHWTRALAMLTDPLAWAFGKGIGRYPASQILSGNDGALAGDYRLRQSASGQHLALSAGKHMQGWGDMFRLSQRMGAFDGHVKLHLDVRADKPAALHAEVCPKHLIYDDGNCIGGALHVAAKPGVWQTLNWTLQEQREGLNHGGLLAHKFLVFSIAVETSGALLEIDNLRLVDAQGRELLANGDFESGMSRWFFSSDRIHLPWHMKSMLLHVLFEQGWVGLSLLCALLVGALWHVTLGTGRHNALAPALAGALLGFVIVGLFDSLLDAPRVAFLFYFLLLVAFMLPSVRAPASPGSSAGSSVGSSAAA